MELMPKMSRDEYLAVMRQKMEALLGQVADAINNAPDGYLIAGSEEEVRDLFADARQQAFELGLQMRMQRRLPPNRLCTHRPSRHWRDDQGNHQAIDHLLRRCDRRALDQAS